MQYFLTDSNEIEIILSIEHGFINLGGAIVIRQTSELLASIYATKKICNLIPTDSIRTQSSSIPFFSDVFEESNLKFKKNSSDLSKTNKKKVFETSGYSYSLSGICELFRTYGKRPILSWKDKLPQRSMITSVEDSIGFHFKSSNESRLGHKTEPWKKFYSYLNQQFPKLIMILLGTTPLSYLKINPMLS